MAYLGKFWERSVSAVRGSGDSVMSCIALKPIAESAGQVNSGVESMGGRTPEFGFSKRGLGIRRCRVAFRVCLDKRVYWVDFTRRRFVGGTFFLL